MQKLFLSTIVSLVLSLPSAAEPAGSQKHHHKTGPELAAACEEHMNRIKDTGASLSPEWKAEFDYNLKIATIEIEALRDPNHKDILRHNASCHRHVKAAERNVKRSEQHAKKVAEHQVKAELDHGKADSEKSS